MSKQMVVGLLLSLVTTLFWGTIPIALQQVVVNMEPLTVVWYRFAFSAIVLGFFLLYKKRIPKLTFIKTKSGFFLLLVAVVGMGGNFIFLNIAIQYISPITLQIITQLTPIMLIAASVLILKESFYFSQLIGALVLVIGIFCFFNDNLSALFTQVDHYTIGVICAFLGAIIWVGYGLAQKVLLGKLDAPQILWLIYVCCAIMFFFLANPKQILQLTGLQFGWLVYCGINTLVAYGALVEAMKRWQVAQVSAVITLTPIFTFIFYDLLAITWPHIFVFHSLNGLSYFGIVAVVIGAMSVAIGHKLLGYGKVKRA